MRKFLVLLSLIASSTFAQQTVEVSYEAIDQEFQAAVTQLFQNFVNQQESQGSDVMISFYDNSGALRVTAGSAGAPSYLRAISDYKVKFMKERQLSSTQNVLYQSNKAAAQ